jgi:hypothetical protein
MHDNHSVDKGRKRTEARRESYGQLASGGLFRNSFAR